MRKLLPLIAELFLVFGFNAQTATIENSVLAPYSGQLVCLQNEKLVPLKNPSFLTAPYTILYFGAGWCPDCRKFSPTLVAAYDAQPSAARKFEVLYISQDRSEAEMRQYMAREKMRWPALAFDKVSRAEDLAKFHPNKSIPWLAVIDRAGRVLLESESDKDAADVLRRLEARVAEDAKQH